MVEISSTLVTPFGVKYLGNPKTHGRHNHSRGDVDGSADTLLERSHDTEEIKTEMGLERLGLWGISFQLINLVTLAIFPALSYVPLLTFLQLPVVFALWSLLLPGSSLLTVLSRFTRHLTSQSHLAFILFFFLSISRLGLWFYDLATQQLTQTMTVGSQRSSFTGIEYCFISLFELAHHVMTIVFHKPEQFKWIALISFMAVATSTIAYAGWVWKTRGHLVH